MFWVAGICILFFMPADTEQTSLCIFRLVGIDKCPGCGLGHSIHYALHLNIEQSLQEHLLGVPATFIILFRIKQLIYPKKTTIYEA